MLIFDRPFFMADKRSDLESCLVSGGFLTTGASGHLGGVCMKLSGGGGGGGAGAWKSSRS